MEIGKLKNENQRLVDLEQEYMEKLKNTQMKFQNDKQ